jgi:predicted transcriptional regulator
MTGTYYHSGIYASPQIRQHLIARASTQKEFADSQDIVQGYLIGIERGKKIPSFTLFMRFDLQRIVV